MEDPRLEAFWGQIDTLWLVLERPTVQRQLIAFVVIGLLAWFVPWLINGTLRKISDRRQAQRQNGQRGMSGWQYQLVRWARALSYTFFPVLGLLFGRLAIVLFAASDWRYGLIQRFLPIFWLVLAYRLLIGLMQAVFTPTQSKTYQWRFLAPVFAIISVYIINAGLEGTFPIGELELLRFLDTPVTLRSLFVAAVTLYFFVTLAWLVSDLLNRVVLNDTELDRTSTTTVLTISHYLIVAIGIVTAISVLGFNLTSLALIGGGLSVGIGFGMQELIANFISGILLMFERTVRPGDMIEVGGQKGVVDKLRMRSTVIRTFDNTEIFVPNKNLLTTSFTAYTQTDRVVRRTINVGVSYSSNPTQVRDILQSVASRHGLVLKKPEPAIFFMGFGASSLDFQLFVWVDDPLNGLRVTSDLYFMIWNEFEKNGIEIPFPQQDLHLRSAPWEELQKLQQHGRNGYYNGNGDSEHHQDGAKPATTADDAKRTKSKDDAADASNEGKKGEKAQSLADKLPADRLPADRLPNGKSEKSTSAAKLN